MGTAFEKLMWYATDGGKVKAIRRKGLNINALKTRERTMLDWAMTFYSKHGKTAPSSALSRRFPGFSVEKTDEAISFVIEEVVRTSATEKTLIAFSSLEEIIQKAVPESTGLDDDDDDVMPVMTEDELEQSNAILRSTLQEMEALSEADTDKAENFGRGKDVIEEYYARKNGDSTGVDLPMSEISKHMRGLRFGHLTGILARPGKKKTFVLDLWAGHSAQVGHRTFLHSTEMNQLETKWRVAALMFSLPYTKFCDGEMDGDDEKRMEKAFRLKKWVPLKDNLIIAGPSSVASVIGIDQEMEDNGCSVAFLDNIIGLVSDGSNEQDHVKVRQLMVELKALTLRKQYAVAFTSHQNRTGGKGQNATAYGDGINAYASFLWELKARQEFLDISCVKAREGPTDIGFRYKADLNSCDWGFVKQLSRDTGEVDETGIM